MSPVPIVLIVDGNVIDESNYTVTEGSTVVTFTKAFFDSLGEGEHTVEIISEDGSAQALFDIAKSTIPVENPSGTIDSYSWSEIQYLARLNLSKEEYMDEPAGDEIDECMKIWDKYGEDVMHHDGLEYELETEAYV